MKPGGRGGRPPGGSRGKRPSYNKMKNDEKRQSWKDMDKAKQAERERSEWLANFNRAQDERRLLDNKERWAREEQRLRDRASDPYYSKVDADRKAREENYQKEITRRNEEIRRRMK